MNILRIISICAVCAFVSCTPPSDPSALGEFGTAPPEQQTADFASSAQYRTEGVGVMPHGMTIPTSGKIRVVAEMTWNINSPVYSPVSNSAIFVLNNGVFAVEHSIGEVVSAAQDGGSVLNGIVSDAVGNYYIVGKNKKDILLSKYNASGGLVWSKVTGSTTNKEEGKAIAAHASGNIAIGGYFNGTGIYDTQDAYLAQYNAQGEMLWSKSIWSVGFDEIQAVAYDADGNILVAGVFTGGRCTLDSIKLDGKGSSLFLASYTPEGKVRWAKKADGAGLIKNSSDFGDVRLSVAGTGEIYLAGTMNEKIIFDGITTLSGSRSLFLARFQAHGQMLWSKSAVGYTPCDALCATNDGVLVAGRFLGEVIFDNFGIRVGSNNLLYVGSYSKDGNLRWLKYAGKPSNPQTGTSTPRIGAIGVEGEKTIYIAGQHFDNIVVGATTLAGGASYDVTYPPNGGRNSMATMTTSRRGVMLLSKIIRK